MIRAGLLDGKPANAVLCEYCGKGVAVASARADPRGPGWEVITARFQTDTEGVQSRFQSFDDNVVSILPMPAEDIPAAADHIGSLIGMFLNAWWELHLSCQGDTRDVDET